MHKTSRVWARDLPRADRDDVVDAARRICSVLDRQFPSYVLLCGPFRGDRALSCAGNYVSSCVAAAPLCAGPNGGGQRYGSICAEGPTEVAGYARALRDLGHRRQDRRRPMTGPARVS